MDLGIAGRTAIVTGASRGIGRSVAERLCREGANVTLCARSQETLAEAKRTLEALGGGHVLTEKADLTDQAAAGRVVEATVAVIWWPRAVRWQSLHVRPRIPRANCADCSDCRPTRAPVLSAPRCATRQRSNRARR